MPSIILNGKELAAQCNKKTATSAAEYFLQFGRKPSLVLIEVGEDQASSAHVKRKSALADQLGILATIHACDKSITLVELKNVLTGFAKADDIDAILLQLPLPGALAESATVRELIDLIPTKKDVDGLNADNISRLRSGDETGLLPCTPQGILDLIELALGHFPESASRTLEAKECVVIGRSELVGAPTAFMLENRGSTVSVCHSGTSLEELKKLCLAADIIVSAAGSPKLVTEDMVSEGAIVIDVGMTYLKDQGIVGDVDFEAVAKKAFAITPMPGGVGPMTMAKLMENVVRCAQLRVSDTEDSSPPRS